MSDHEPTSPRRTSEESAGDDDNLAEAVPPNASSDAGESLGMRPDQADPDAPAPDADDPA